MSPDPLERHLSPNEIAEMWGLSSRTIRRIFQDEPGALKIGLTFRAKRGVHQTLRIPLSVVERVHSARRR